MSAVCISLKEIIFGGDDWLIARFNHHPRSLGAALQNAAEKLRRSEFWLEVVPSAYDISTRFDPLTCMPDQAKARLFAQLRLIEVPQLKQSDLIRVPVCYGGEFGPDLSYCAKTLALSAEKIIELHSTKPFIIEFMGFAPGFAYCGETPEQLNISRLNEPRSYLEAGSVGIAGRQTCLYSLAGPGGWPIIGRTPLKLFDASSHTPFLLKGGGAVRFYEIDEAEFHRLQDSQ